MQDPHDINLAMDFSLRVGEMLLASGAGAADVTVAMREVARVYGIRLPEIDVTFTALSISVHEAEDSPSLFQLRQVKQREIDYEDLTLVDHLVREVLGGEVDLKEARTRLARIVSSGHATPRWLTTLAWGVMCAGVGLMLGGNLAVIVSAFVAAALIDRLQLLLSRRRLPTFYQQVAGGVVATLLAVGVSATPFDVDPSLVVTANIIMLLAGIGFMGALQDALSGFYVTAGARILEALLATSGIIAGVSAGISLAEAAGIDLGTLTPGTVGLESLTTSAVGGAICAGAFAWASYAPTRSLLPIALLGGAAIVAQQLVLGADFGPTWATALGAFLVGVVSFSVAGRIRVPPLVVVVSAVAPMLPGLSIFRGLSLMANDGRTTSAGLLAMVTAAAVATAIASGVILGEYVAQPLKREARRLESRLAGPRLVGPTRAPSRRERRRNARLETREVGLDVHQHASE
jgi:uncharacterized membrane protein YjjP (DUF1212 family)